MHINNVQTSTFNKGFWSSSVARGRNVQIYNKNSTSGEGGGGVDISDKMKTTRIRL